jgi:hypothetical protein
MKKKINFDLMSEEELFNFCRKEEEKAAFEEELSRAEEFFGCRVTRSAATLNLYRELQDIIHDHYNRGNLILTADDLIDSDIIQAAVNINSSPARSENQLYNWLRRRISEEFNYSKATRSWILSACFSRYLPQIFAKRDLKKAEKELKEKNKKAEKELQDQLKNYKNIQLTSATPEEIWIKKAENLQLNNFCEINYLYKKLPATFMKLTPEIRFQLLNLREYYRENNIWGSFIK